MSRDSAERQSLPGLSLPVPAAWPPDAPFPEFSRPRRLGCLSVPAAGGAAPRADASELKRLRLPESWAGLDLNDWLPGGADGWEAAEPPTKPRDADDLLEWLRLARPSLAGRLVCCRGLLTRLTCFQLERQQDLCVAAVRAGGGVLLCQFKGAESVRLAEGQTRRDRLMAAWGRAFEAAVTSGGGDGGEGAGVSSGCYCEIVEARLRDLRLLYLGEVDCQDGDPEGGELVELKLTGQHGGWGKRLPRWWAQSFLLGVPLIVAGFRDNAGRLRDVAQLRVDALPAMAHEHLRPSEWSPAAGLGWAHAFLSHVRSVCLDAEEASAAFVFYWTPGMDRVLASRHGPGSPFYFLPHWLLRDLSQLRGTPGAAKVAA